VCGRNRLTPGRLGRGPVSQGTPHAVEPTHISFSDSLSEQPVCEKDPGYFALPDAKSPSRSMIA